jgi:hypothetical protein
MENENFESTGSPEADISACQTFDALFEIIRGLEGIQGSAKYYSSEKLLSDINEVRKGDRGIGYITNTFKLRDKVTELLRTDEVHIQFLKNG